MVVASNLGDAPGSGDSAGDRCCGHLLPQVFSWGGNMNSFIEIDRGTAFAGRTCRRSLLARRAQRMVTSGGGATGRPGTGQRLARVLAGALGLTAAISGVFAAVPAGASASVN